MFFSHYTCDTGTNEKGKLSAFSCLYEIPNLNSHVCTSASSTSFNSDSAEYYSEEKE